jgi:hypothetical protein
LEKIVEYENFSYLWISRHNILRMAVLPRATYGVNEIPIKIPIAFFKEIEKSVLKFVWKLKRP